MRTERMGHAIKRTAENAWAWFANLTMHQKLWIVFLFLVTLPMLAVGYLSSQSYTRSIKANTIDYATEITSKTLVKLDDYVLDLYNMSAMPLYNTYFLSLLQKPDIGLSDLDSIDLYIANLNKIKPDTVSVYVFDNYGHVYYNIKSNSQRNNFNEARKKWEEIAAKRDGRPALVSIKDVETGRNQHFYAFSVVRQLKELSQLKPIGFIVFDTSITAISRQIQDLDRVTKGKTLLLDENNRVVYDSEGTRTMHDLSSDEFVRKSRNSWGTFTARMDGIPYLVTYANSSLTGWKMMVYIPMSEITRHAELTRKRTLLLTGVIIALAFTFAVAISFALTRPLNDMKLLMKEVQSGNLDVRFQYKYRDEVGLLGRNFNMMIVRIQELLATVRNTELRKREAELEALQNQINPHFIYNTLEMIRMRAELSDDEEAADMIWMLGKLLRYNINIENPFVTVRKEIEHLQHYMALQKMRFSGKYRLELDIPESMYEQLCLKLIFQPIVENAITHAYKQKLGHGTIRVMGKPDGSVSLFVIEDDGAGMDDCHLQKMKEHIESPRPIGSERGIGLRNINERIKLQYGQDYGITVESQERIGTRVIMRLPKESMEREV